MQDFFSSKVSTCRRRKRHKADTKGKETCTGDSPINVSLRADADPPYSASARMSLSLTPPDLSGNEKKRCRGPQPFLFLTHSNRQSRGSENLSSPSCFRGAASRSVDKTRSSCSKMEYDSACHVKAMWTEQYKPSRTTELAIPPRKVNEIRQWLERAWPPLHHEQTHTQRFLILRGPPGIGKSTTIQVLSEELGLEVVTWAESTSFWSGSNGTPVEEACGLGETGRYIPQVEDFSAFLRAAAYPSLHLVDSGMHRIKRSSGLRPSQQLQDCKKSAPKLVLIEELPYHGDIASQTRFQVALNEYLSVAMYPVVLVFTEHNEARGSLHELEKMVGKSALCSVMTHQIHCNHVTESNLSRVLRRVAIAECLPLRDTEFAELVALTRGDLRHALLEMQLRHPKGLYKRKHQRPSREAIGQAKDLSLSSFHVIGKLLRTTGQISGREGNGRGRASIDLDAVIRCCGMDLEILTLFLHSHFVERFGMVEDLQDALMCFSDSDVLRSHVKTHRTSSDSGFPAEHAMSLIIRGLAAANRHPPQHKIGWRPFTAPRYLQVVKTSGERYIDLLGFCDKNSITKESAVCRPCRIDTLLTTIPLVRHIVAGGQNKSSKIVSLDTPGCAEGIFGATVLTDACNSANGSATEDDIVEE